MYDIDCGSKFDNFSKTNKETSDYEEKTCGYGTNIRDPMGKLNVVIIKILPKL